MVNMYVALDVSLYADRIAGEYVIHVTGGTLRRLYWGRKKNQLLRMSAEIDHTRFRERPRGRKL